MVKMGLTGNLAAMNISIPSAKFSDPDVTAKGETRAHVKLVQLETLWVNTGTLCNIECANCYIHSSPTEDRLSYFTLADTLTYLDEIDRDGLGTKEIGFTGGEPFMNPDMLSMAQAALERGYQVLILTNAMQPMMRPKIREGLLALKARYGMALRLRISIDHYSKALHDAERGAGSFEKTLSGLKWLAAEGFPLTIAGRTAPGESEEDERAGYAALFARHGIKLNPHDPSTLIVFPEMDDAADVPEITTACWGVLNVNPDNMMCATSRMIVKRKGESQPVVVACTLLPDDPQFELGQTLNEASGAVKLNHRHCAKFCVLGGASCSG